MKIRGGFVSNSSSSSFVIVGISKNSEITSDEEFDKLFEAIDNRVVKSNLIDVEYGQDDYNRYIGIDLVKGSETMTLPQMKEEFLTFLKSNGIETTIDKIKVHEECWYNG